LTLSNRSSFHGSVWQSFVPWSNPREKCEAAFVSALGLTKGPQELIPAQSMASIERPLTYGGNKRGIKTSLIHGKITKSILNRLYTAIILVLLLPYIDCLRLSVGITGRS
jgi:hypothetical protein